MAGKIKKTIQMWRAEGAEVTLRYCASYLQYRVLGRRLLSIEDIYYEKWREKRQPSAERLEAIRGEISRFTYRPLISIVMPVYNVESDLLRKAIASVERQLYTNWELCIADDCSTNRETMRELARLSSGKTNVKVRYLERNAGIAGASNAALELASGEFIGLLDHDDELSPDALFEVVKLLNESQDADFIYTDEDKLDERGRHVEAFMKPDWSPEFLLANMYTCHLGVYRRRLINEVGGFRAGFDGAQDFDLALRLTERTRRIHHIPKALYHWRRTGGSTSIEYGSTFGGKSAVESSIRALEEALKRRRIPGTVETGSFSGSYRVRPALPPRSLVSIIVPTRDRAEYLRGCIDSIIRLTKRPRYEIIIVDNDSAEVSAKQYLASVASEERVRVIPYAGEFNFSKILNMAAARAEGETLLFLNNDTEVFEGGWLEAMLEVLQLPEVGVVGAKLLYPDDTVQHAGVVLWHCGTAGHLLSRLPRDERGYLGMADVIRNCSAVSGACMMVGRSLFERLRGLDETYTVSYQDVDFCLRAAQEGFRTVYTPFAQLYHHESASTGTRKDEREERIFGERWKRLVPTDRYYNNNFPADRLDFKLR